LADQLTLFKPWGEDYACHNTASPPPHRIQNAIYTSVKGALTQKRTLKQLESPPKYKNQSQLKNYNNRNSKFGWETQYTSMLNIF
jgi:hypothetical protein